MIERMEGVSFAYSKKEGDVIESISLSLEEGKVGVLLGPNGAGKSTIIKLLLGLLRPDEGSVSLLGKDIRKCHRSDIARTIAYVPQSISFPPTTVLDAVMLGRIMHAKTFYSKEDAVAAALALREVGIEDLAFKDASKLSGGQKQRVAIARAIATEAKAVIFDEPTSSLDIKGSKDVANLIGKLKNMGKAILVSLHDIELAHAIGDEFHLLCRKSFICSGGKETLTKENLERTYETPIALIKQGDELFVSYRKGE